jgi:hypothetical protein
VTSSYFQKLNCSWKDAGLTPLRGSRPNCRECLTLWQKRTSRTCSKNGRDSGTSAYMWEGTNSRVIAADRPYGEFKIFIGSVRNILNTPSYIFQNTETQEYEKCEYTYNMLLSVP